MILLAVLALIALSGGGILFWILIKESSRNRETVDREPIESIKTKRQGEEAHGNSWKEKEADFRDSRGNNGGPDRTRNRGRLDAREVPENGEAGNQPGSLVNHEIPGNNGGRKHPGRPSRLQHWHKVAILLTCYDMFTVMLAYFLALWIRFDCRYSAIPTEYLGAYVRFLPLYLLVCLPVYWLLRLYKSVWRFAGYNELLRCILAACLTGIFHILGITLLYGPMPLSYYLFGLFFQLVFGVLVRFSYRFILLERGRAAREKSPTARKAMLIGAGAAGQLILKDVNNGKKGDSYICCIIDDNENKKGRYIEGVPIVGTRDDILLNAKKYQVDEILLAIPSSTAREKRDILNICKETGCELKSLPGMYQLVNGEVSVSQMRKVAIEDLLGRDPIKVEMGEIFSQLSGKVILVTGGGGSIGSELCRQIAGHSPRQLVIFDIYENNAYDIEQELKRSHPDLNLKVLIGSVRDSRRVEGVFRQYRPDIVYHAAAHKHVPLMEASPCEAVKNNVVGTYKTACAALRWGCSRFVLISTDKAVNPTNIMGASKRLCEMVIQGMDQVSREGREGILPFLYAHKGEEPEGLKEMGALSGREASPWREPSLEAALQEAACTREGKGGRTEFVAVRFGNVLGSNGSVIPLFQKQIEQGGPVTVTHPDIIRYFMTIPEAVSLVLQAGTYAHGGEIFVLDMGEPMKIDTLARNMIKLSGYQPDKDIQIAYTGLRPGEKLYEEKLMAEEGMKKTANELIHIGEPIPFDLEEFFKQLRELAYASYENWDGIGEMVKEMVPTFHPEESLYETEKKDNGKKEAAAALE